MAKKNLIIVEVSGKTYLGHLDEGENTVLSDALRISSGELSTRDIESWYAAKEIEELPTLNIKGALNYTTIPLSRDMLSHIPIVEGYLEEAREFAGKKIVIAEFNRLCGVDSRY